MKINMTVYEKLVGEEWEPILVRKLQKGDKFRVSESGKLLGEYTASCNPYKSGTGDNTKWTIDGE